MIRQSDRRRSVFMGLVLGAVAGVACSNDTPAVVADVVASLTAAEVSYDPAASAMTATDVQAAIDELAAALAAAPSAESVEIAVTEATGPLSDRLDILEAGGSVSADDIAYEGGDEPATVAAALDAAMLRLDALEQAAATRDSRVLALEAGLEEVSTAHEQLVQAHTATQEQLDALGECPEGFGEAGNTCIESTDRPPTGFLNAIAKCSVDGYHLCDAVEYFIGCSNGNIFTIDEVMWTATVIDANIALGAKGPGQCTFANYFEAVTVTNTTRSYRCCYTR